MKRSCLLILAALLLATAALAADTRLLRYPDIHQDQIVFVYGGDLWTVSSSGGTARRLTTHPGQEQYPKFSPDGRYIAFSGVYDGNTDVYIIPAMGGEPKRLTYHPGTDFVVDWYPDGRHILFRSPRNSSIGRFNRLFKVSVGGGYPEMLPLPEGELSSFNADASRIAYNRIAREERTWKRYRGGMVQEIWVYDFAGNTIENITANPATDTFPMWQGDTIYFLSDRDPDIKLNLYAYDTTTRAVRQLTRYGKNDYDVKWPSIGPGAIVYQNGGWLHVLDLASGKSRKLTVDVYTDNVLARPRLVNVQQYIQNGDISPTGKRVVLEARGDIFTVPAEKGDIHNISDSQGVRERCPVWSPDARWIAYVSDRTGEFEVYVRRSDGQGEEKPVTTGISSQFRNLKWSPDSKKVMFSTVTSSLYYVDIESGARVRIDQMKYSGSTSYLEGNWSPDSRWIAYAMPDPNQRSSVWLYSLDQAKSFRVTGQLTNDSNPAFDPDGKYLFWVADREVNFTFDRLDFQFATYNPSQIVLATLQTDTPNPLAPESDEEEIKEEEKQEEREKKAEGGEESAEKQAENGDKARDAEKKEKKEEGVKPVEIDVEGLESRLVNLPLPDGNYGNLQPAKGMLFFTNGSADPSQPGAALQVFLFQPRKVETVLPQVSNFILSADGKKIVWSWQNNIGIIDAKPGQKTGTGQLDLSGLQMFLDYEAEWRQIYYDAWRLFRDMFYDPGMHGVDWEAMKKRYEVLLPYVAHRDDLNYVIGELIGELNTGHSYRRGGEYPRYPRVNVGVLACDFEPDPESGFYRIGRIYEGHNWDPQRRSPLLQPGLKVKAGDYLIAIDDVEIKAPENPYAHLVNTVGKSITLKVSDKPAAEGARDIIVQPVGNDSVQRYIDWVMANLKKVEAASDGRIGYIHLPDTAFGGWEWFSRLFMFQADKEAIIIDGRYNGGGFDPVVMLEKLTRQLSALWVSRYSEPYKTPSFAVMGPKVCLTNFWAGSGGDNLPFTFRTFGLGPIIGTRTWGGLVGYNPGAINPLVDNGSVAIPMIAFVNPQGEFDVENKGVTPDMVVDNLPPDVIDGRDPQLEAGIQYLLDELKKRPNPIPMTPSKYPVR